MTFRGARFFLRTEPFTPKKKPKKEVDYFWKQHFVPWHRDTLVTGAAADEHNLNVVDCDASVTVPRLSSIPVLKWGSASGGYPQPPPEANVKDNGFPWPPPGLLGIFLFYPI